MSGLTLVAIPDTQVRDGVPTEHLLAAGNYVATHEPDIVVMLGDHWDMPSLNRYASKFESEAMRVKNDLKAGNDALDLFMQPIHELNDKRRRHRTKLYRPRLIYITGNHDPQVRLPRMIEDHPILDGYLECDTDKRLMDHGFEVVPFREIINVEGVRISHFFSNPHSAKKAPQGGTIDNMLKSSGFSFIQGHTQGMKFGKHYLTDGTKRIGIVAGSFYQHDETYMGPQGNKHWHGIIRLDNLKDGYGDFSEITLDRLMEEYL